MENGIKHGRLPLDKFLLMKARKVLTIDHGKKKKIKKYYKHIYTVIIIVNILL